MNKKAQISVEFFVVLIVLFSILLFSVFVFSEKNSGFIYSKEQFEAKLAADGIAGKINQVFLAGNGAKTTHALESTFDYNAVFSGNSVQVHWRQNFAGSALMTSDISGPSLKAGDKITIENSFGGIIIETV